MIEARPLTGEGGAGCARNSPRRFADAIEGSNIVGAVFYLEGDKLMRVRVGPDTPARFGFQAPVAADRRCLPGAGLSRYALPLRFLVIFQYGGLIP